MLNANCIAFTCVVTRAESETDLYLDYIVRTILVPLAEAVALPVLLS